MRKLKHKKVGMLPRWYKHAVLTPDPGSKTTQAWLKKTHPVGLEEIAGLFSQDSKATNRESKDSILPYLFKSLQSFLRVAKEMFPRVSWCQGIDKNHNID